MTIELEEVRAFLAQHAPWSELPDDALDALPQAMDMIYVRRGTVVIAPGDPNDFLHIIRSGAVDVSDAEGGLLDRRDAGAAFGFSTLNGENASLYSMEAVEDSLLLRLPREEFKQLAERFPFLDIHFAERSARIRAAAESLRDNTSAEVMRAQLRSFMEPHPAMIPVGTSIKEGAEVMERSNSSALLVTRGDELAGILTDRDMRKMVARGIDTAGLVDDVMTANPRVASPDTLAFEAMLVMSEYGFHHIPVVEQNRVAGIVSSADIVRLLRHNPIYLTAELSRFHSPEEMRETYASAGEIATRFIERGASPEEVSTLLTVAADALARRLLTLAEEKLGPPPVPYCFAVLGSQGRRGMGLASDQDNCLVLSDDYQPEHDAYFAQLSEYVCRGLDTAGQVLCPGDMMAMNPEWRMTESTWISTFRNWITAPEPDALLHAQTFFDFRGIHGDIALAERVHEAAVQMASHAPRMQAHLAALAARREPPLSFFRGFVLERSGEYAQTLDVKKGGIAAIVQMARLFSLATESMELGTDQRLQAAAGSGLSTQGAANLIDAYEFLLQVSLRWQAEQLRRGEQPSYHIDPKSLSKMDRENLRDAFQIIKNIQTALATKFPIRNI